MDLGPLGKDLYSAEHVVSLRGPETRSDPFKNIARVTVPVPILHGTADQLAERLKASAMAAQSVQFHAIPGADHALLNHADSILPVLIPWVEVLSR